MHTTIVKQEFASIYIPDICSYLYNMYYYSSSEQYTLFNNNTPHSEQRWTVLIRQLLHTFQWQSTTQWPTLNCLNPFKSEFTIVISSTTSRELLSQFSPCSGWRWFDVVDKLRKLYEKLYEN